MIRWLILALCLVVTALGIGQMVQHVVLSPAPDQRSAVQPPPLPPPPTEPVVSVHARVTEVSGVAEVYRAEVGRWVALGPDTRLTEDAVLRTGKGRVTLTLGDGVQVTIDQGSQFRLRELTNRLAKVMLEQGLVTGSVSAGTDGTLVVQVLGSDAEARTSLGDFAVMRSGQGQVTIAAQSGAVAVKAAGTEVVVRGGEQSVVQPGATPTLPAKISGELFIKLVRGRANKLRYRSTLLEGETAPGAIVEVNDVEVPTHNGAFSVTVPLKEGSNDVHIASRDVLGRKTEEVIRGINVDTSPPSARGTVKW